MHTRVSWWTDESILWYERASRACDYHRKLTAEIERHISRNDSILELGCGLGYEAELLSSDGYDIRAYDKEQKVIEEARRRTGKDIYLCSDVTDVRSRADVVLCINYGHIENAGDLKRIADHAKKKVVYVISRHSGHKQDTRADRTDLIAGILDKEGLRYVKEDLSLDFNQPLRTMDEARAFIRWTYMGKHENQYLGFLEKTDDQDFPYIFKNRKSLVVFVIEKEEFR